MLAENCFHYVFQRIENHLPHKKKQCCNVSHKLYEVNKDETVLSRFNNSRKAIQLTKNFFLCGGTYSSNQGARWTQKTYQVVAAEFNTRQWTQKTELLLSLLPDNVPVTMFSRKYTFSSQLVLVVLFVLAVLFSIY